MRDDNYEWDDRKAARNEREHGVSFETARLVFGDPNQLLLDDNRQDYGEDRYVILGIVGGALLQVAYTCRGERIRIISARGAAPYEHRLNHESQG